MTAVAGPFDGGAGATLGEDFYADELGPLLQSDGVDGDPSTSDLQVYGNSSGMTVFVRPGRAIVRGAAYSSDADVSVTVPDNPTGQARVDRIVLRHDRVANTLAPHLIEGTAGAGVPAITQTVGGVWDLPLGQVTVDAGLAAGSGSIAPNRVTDERRFMPVDRVVCTSTTRPSSARTGQLIYETDTKLERIYDGNKWQPYPSDTGWLPVSAAGAWDVSNAKVRRIGGVVFVTGDIKRTGPTVAAGRQNAAVVRLPASCKPGVPMQHTYTGWLVQTQREFVQLTVQPNGDLDLYYTPVDIVNGAVMELSTTFPGV